MSACPSVGTTGERTTTSTSKRTGPSVAIACQGGGSHTAFTAGVLAQLLSAPELAQHQIVGVSGTSGGAVCATLAWSALRDDDRKRASSLLTDFWADNAADGPLERFVNSWLIFAATLQSYGLLPAVSPYHTPVSAIGLDEFRVMLERHIDFEAFDVDDAGAHPRLLLGAVDVQSGAFHAFDSRRDRITAESVLASAAIPTLFRAVSVDGASYWDGLFSQNPPVRELLDSRPDELWVLQVNPRARADVPETLLDIEDRRNELSGNLSLYQELAFIEKVDELLEQGVIVGDRYKQVMVRVVELPAEHLERVRGPASKLNRDPVFLDTLVDLGRAQADRFLQALAFEQLWRSGDVAALVAALDPHVELSIDPAFAMAQRRGDDERVSSLVAAVLCDSVQIDSAHKQIAGDRVSWSIRVRQGDRDVRGTAEVAFGTDRVSSLHVRTGS